MSPILHGRPTRLRKLHCETSRSVLRNLAFSIAAELRDENIHVTTVTIGGHIEAGTALDSDRIAAEYWRLHTQKSDDWERELVLN